MKQLIKLTMAAGIILAAFSSPAQNSCATSATVNTDGSWRGQDSFSVGERWHRFTATQDNYRIKLFIKNYNPLQNNIDCYQNNCSLLTSVSSTLTNSGDSVEVNVSGLTVSNDYLIRLGNNNSPAYEVYNINLYSIFPAPAALIVCTSTNCGYFSNCGELVCNGSFECTNNVVTQQAQIFYSNGWNSANQYGSPDLLSALSINSSYLVPCNAFGFEPGHNNSNTYAGICVGGANYFSESIQTELNAPMQMGKQYIIGFWVSKSDFMNAQINEIAIYSSTSPILGPGAQPLNLTPIGVYTNTTELNNTSGWSYISFCYTPSQPGEQFLAIGGTPNSFLGTLTPPTQCNNNNNCGCNPQVFNYIFIDDVSVRATDAIANSSQYFTCPNVPVQLTAYAPGCAPLDLYSPFWSPGTGLNSQIFINPVATVSNNTNYQITLNFVTTSGQTCSGTNTVSVLVFPNQGLSINATQTNVCNGQTATLTAVGGAVGSCTWFPGGVQSNSIAVSINANTVYTVSCINESGCTETATIQLNFIPGAPINVVISPTSAVACNTMVTNLSASPSAGLSYTWQPGNVSPSNNITVSPTATTIYTASTTQTNGCVYSATSTITVVPCTCLSYTNLPQNSGLITGSFVPNTAYVIAGTASVGAAPLSMMGNEIIFFPGSKLVLPYGGVLFIDGSHLHGCGELWDGIEVQDGGQLVIQPMSLPKGNIKTTLIEDAKMAVNIVTVTPGLAPNFSLGILTVDNATFNKNVISIRINGYIANINQPYPFKIRNSLFTSRNIPTSLLVWPQTNTIKNMPSGNLSPLQAPYINNGVYPPAPITSTFVTGFPSNGIIINNVGYTTNNFAFMDIQIGQNGTNNFNLFDNLREDITLNNTNLTIFNSVFQNGQRFGKGSVPTGLGGKAIVANSSLNAQVPRNRIQIIAGSNSGNFPCRFYEKVAAADINDYFVTTVQYAQVYSFSNDYSQFLASNTIGERGLNLTTSRYYSVDMENNIFYNIKNAMLIGLTSTNTGPPFGTIREIGTMQVQNNSVNRYLGVINPGSTPYVNVGVSIADPFGAPITVITNGTIPNISVLTNTFDKVHNGVSATDVSNSPVTITSNTVSMINEPPSFVFPVPQQKGIIATNMKKRVMIHTNVISGVANYGQGMKALTTALNGSLSVRCNTTSSTFRGIEFNKTQTCDFFEDNYMTSQRFGFVLDNSAVVASPIFTIGSFGRPTDNVWSGTWNFPSNVKTATFGGSTSLSNRLYINNNLANPALNPAGSTTTSANAGVDDYNYLGIFGTLLQSSVATSPSCRISTGGNGGGNNAAKILLEQAVSNSIPYAINTSENQHIDKTYAYGVLKSSPGIMAGSNILTNFYNAAQSNNLQALVSIEENLASGNINAAQGQINSLNPVNSIETNYKNFYQVFKNFKDSTYNSSDSLSLINLANMCPYTDGAVVFQARALYNIIYTGYYRFIENCGGNVGGRMLNVEEPKEEKQINVLLKSTIYPNPNPGNFVLKVNSPAEKPEKQSVEISIFDITGKQVYKESRMAENASEINMSHNLTNGAYLVKIKFEDGSIDVHRLIIDK